MLLLGGVAYQVLTTHQVAHATDRGIPPGEPGREILRSCQLSERQTLDLLQEQRQRLQGIAERESVRLLAGEPTHRLDEGRLTCQLLWAASDGRPAIARVAQWPGSVVPLELGSCRPLLVPLGGRGLVRWRGDGGLLFQLGQVVEIPATASVDVAAVDDLPLAYLLIGVLPQLPSEDGLT